MLAGKIRHCCCHALMVTHVQRVALNRLCPRRCQLGLRRRHLIRVAGGDGHDRTPFGKSLGNAEIDAAGPAKDKDLGTGEIELGTGGSHRAFPLVMKNYFYGRLELNLNIERRCRKGKAEHSGSIDGHRQQQAYTWRG